MAWKPFKRSDGKAWTIRPSDHLGRRFEITFYPDRKLTERAAGKLARLIMFRQAGAPLDPELAQWVESLPTRILERLVAQDLLDAATKQRLQPLEDLIVSFERHLTQKGSTEQHVAVVMRQLRTLVELGGVHYARELTKEAVSGAIERMLEGKPELSVTTVNHYIGAVKTFARWLAAERDITTNVMYMPKRKALKESPRRALSPTEARDLVAAAHGGGKHNGMEGSDRALLYMVAMATGLRAGSLAGLTSADCCLDAEQPYLFAKASASKSGKEQHIPIKASLARLLASYIEARGLGPGDPLFDAPWTRLARMVRKDLKAAGIPFEVRGKKVDFHALRATAATHLRLAGADLKTAQQLLGHSNVELTARHYNTVFPEEMARAADRLPELMPAEDE